MSRVLLLVPTTSYRTHDFMEAARRLDVDVVLGSNERQVLEQVSRGGTLTVDLDDHEQGAERILAFARSSPLDAVVGVDDGSNVVAARAAALLGLRHNRPEAVWAARNKHLFRQRLDAAGLPSPRFRLASVHDDAARMAREIGYPCVLKPLTLNMSRGVIRADGSNSFVAAFHRVAQIIAQPDAAQAGEAGERILIEDYIPGAEYALEGLIDKGRLEVLAIFDKPDPLEGPFFEETIYVQPAKLGDEAYAAIVGAAQDAVRAVGLWEGPTHIDLRVNAEGVFIIEADARSIGGYCGRSLRFGAGTRLEEIILRHALGWPIETLAAMSGAGGVMMIPIPRSGILRRVRGLEAARALPGIEEVAITIAEGRPVVMLPEGSKYLGFILARGERPEDVVAALRAAHGRLDFAIEDPVDSAA